MQLQVPAPEVPVGVYTCVSFYPFSLSCRPAALHYAIVRITILLQLLRNGLYFSDNKDELQTIYIAHVTPGRERYSKTNFHQ